MNPSWLDSRHALSTVEAVLARVIVAVGISRDVGNSPPTDLGSGFPSPRSVHVSRLPTPHQNS